LRAIELTTTIRFLFLPIHSVAGLVLVEDEGEGGREEGIEKKLEGKEKNRKVDEHEDKGIARESVSSVKALAQI